MEYKMSSYILFNVGVIVMFFDGVFTECVRSGSCKCEASGGVIDLSLLPIQSFSANAKDTSSTPPINYNYAYSPCMVVGCGSSPPSPNIAVCQSTLGPPGAHYCAGKLPSAKFSGEPEKNLKVEYTCITEGVTRTSFINLICNSDLEYSFEVTAITGANYTMALSSKYLCYPKGLSIGSILVILFFVFLVIYLVGGALFLRFRKGARGLEMFPNLEFWKDFPFVVKDGVVFVLRGCKADSTYSQI